MPRMQLRVFIAINEVLWHLAGSTAKMASLQALFTSVYFSLQLARYSHTGTSTILLMEELERMIELSHNKSLSALSRRD